MHWRQYNKKKLTHTMIFNIWVHQMWPTFNGNWYPRSKRAFFFFLFFAFVTIFLLNKKIWSKPNMDIDNGIPNWIFQMKMNWKWCSLSEWCSMQHATFWLQYAIFFLVRGWLAIVKITMKRCGTRIIIPNKIKLMPLPMT